MVTNASRAGRPMSFQVAATKKPHAADSAAAPRIDAARIPAESRASPRERSTSVSDASRVRMAS